MPSLRQPECASHRHDRIQHHGHHWIEEGTDEDFRRNVIESDLPEFIVYADTDALMGTNFLLGYRGANFMDLTGTCIPVPYPADRIGEQGEQGVYYIHQDMAKVEQKVLEMLMARPEVVNHEPQASPPLAQKA
jgi:hypothetical protein